MSRAPAERWAEHVAGEADAGCTVQEILTSRLGVSRRMIQKLTRSRGVRLNRRPAFLGRRVRAGDVVAVRLTAAEAETLEPVPIGLSIVHEDEDLLLLDKPPGLLVHPTAPAHTRTLSHGVAQHFADAGLAAKVRPIHRIDRDTSGLVLFAKSAYAHQRLDRQLREGRLRREYLALVQGVLASDEGVMDEPIARDPRAPQLRAVSKGGEPARTRYAVAERYESATLVRLELDTGRTHQIRVHLAHHGHPLLGDRAYGGPDAPPLRRQALHAWRLRFRHPSNDQQLSFEAPLPADIAAARDALRRNESAAGSR